MFSELYTAEPSFFNVYYVASKFKKTRLFTLFCCIRFLRHQEEKQSDRETANEDNVPITSVSQGRESSRQNRTRRQHSRGAETILKLGSTISNKFLTQLFQNSLIACINLNYKK